MRSAVPGDLHQVAAWIEVVCDVASDAAGCCDDAAGCCDVLPAGPLAGLWHARAEIDPYVTDSVTLLWSACSAGGLP